MTPTEYYSSNITRYTETLKSLKQRSALISFLRLHLFAGALFFCYLLVKQSSFIVLAAMILSLVLFIILVRISLTLSGKKNLARELLFINKNEKGILEGKENEFTSQAGITGMAMHTYDLDIFGKRSLFHLLNRTTTTYGNRMLARMLNEPMLNETEIVEQQEATKVLTPQIDIRQLITAHGLIEKEKEGKIEEVITWIKTGSQLSNKNG